MNACGWSVLVAGNLVVAMAIAQSPAARDQELIERLERALYYEVEAKQLPALDIALVDGGRVLWSASLHDPATEEQAKAADRRVYRVGSVSKLFTDLAVMQLVEAGQLSLDEPVTTYLPGFKPRDPYGVPITLAMLMSHRAGLVREPPVGHYFDPDEPSLAATVESLNQTALVYKPGTKTKYSNAGIAVVGAVLEARAGKPFWQQIDETILRPVGMSESSFVLTDSIKAHLAPARMWTYDGRRFAAPNFALGTAPAGNLYASVGDLAKFLVCLFHGGRAGERQIIGPGTLAAMTAPQMDADGKPLGFGLGFHIEDLDGHKKIGHGGAVYGYSTQLEALPEEKLGVAAVAALDGANGVVGRLTDYALRLMLARRLGRPWPEYETTGPIPAERAGALTGTYRGASGGATIRELNGRVYAQWADFRHELRASAADGSLVVDDTIGYGTKVTLTGDRLQIGEQTYEREAEEPPPAPPARWVGLIGEYGWDHNVLYVLEDRGQLVALIEWFYTYPLTELSENEFAFPATGLYHGEKLVFTRDSAGRATKVVAAEVTFERRETGTRDGETFRIEPLRPIDELRGEALAATPPREQGNFLPAALVEPATLDATIKLDIRYATTNNFTGAVFYKQARAFLQRPAAEAVARVSARLRERGLGLLIHDGYRPWHVTKMFWEATPDAMKDFVANPALGSRHNRGCAVDLTLYELATGKPIQMVSGYDEFSTRSYPLYPGGTSRQRWYRDLLRRAMEAEGFTVYDFEWWHFDHRDWRRYAIGNATFEELLDARAE